MSLSARPACKSNQTACDSHTVRLCRGLRPSHGRPLCAAVKSFNLRHVKLQRVQFSPKSGRKIPLPIFLAVITAFTATVTLYDMTYREGGSFFLLFFFYNHTGQKRRRNMLGKYIHAAHLTANKLDAFLIMNYSMELAAYGLNRCQSCAASLIVNLFQ